MTKIHYIGMCKCIYWGAYWRIKYWILKRLGKKPLYYWDACERWEGEYVQGLGVYASDGVYFSLAFVVRQHGYTPLWNERDE